MAWEEDDELLDVSDEPSSKRGKSLQREGTPVSLREVMAASSKAVAADHALKVGAAC